MSVVQVPVRRAVSLYSFQEAYYLQELTLQQCINTAVQLGAPGIEVLAEQMMPGFPDLDDAFYASWHEWLDRSGAVALVHDMFLDVQLVRGRILTPDEQVELLRREIRHASRLGCRYIRVVVHTPPDVIARCVPDAEDAGVALLLEVHTPWHIEHPWIQQHLDTYARFGPEHVGLIPDFGIFVARFPRLQAQRAIRDGARADLVEVVTNRYDACSSGNNGPMYMRDLVEEVTARGGSAVDIALAREASRHVWSPPESMSDVMQYIHHAHGKFWDITDDGQEYSIPYPRILGVLKAGNYKGAIASEYEGQAWLRDLGLVDEVAQVRRHQSMLTSLGFPEQ